MLAYSGSSSLELALWGIVNGIGEQWGGRWVREAEEQKVNTWDKSVVFGE